MLEVGQFAEFAQVHCTALGGVDPGSRNHGVTQMLHDLGEAHIARGFGDQQVEAPIRFDTTVIVGQQTLIVVERLAHLRQLLIAAANGSQCGGLGFQAHAQFQNAAHPQRRIDIQSQALFGRTLQHKGADAVPGLHQAGCLQLRNRLPHHGTTDTVLLNNRVLRRQLCARQHLTEQDALGQLGHQVMGQVVAALAGRCIEIFLHGDHPKAELAQS